MKHIHICLIRQYLQIHVYWTHTITWPLNMIHYEEHFKLDVYRLFQMKHDYVITMQSYSIYIHCKSIIMLHCVLSMPTERPCIWTVVCSPRNRDILTNVCLIQPDIAIQIWSLYYLICSRKVSSQLIFAFPPKSI